MKTQVRDMPQGSGGGGKFLKIEVGQSVSVVFRGETVSYWQKWPKGGMKELSDIPKPGFQERFKVNAVVFEDGAFVAKIFDCSLATYNQIATINESMDIETVKCTVTRQATGKGSAYFVMPNLKEPLKPQALKQVSEVALHDLSGQAAPLAAVSGEDLPF